MRVVPSPLPVLCLLLLASAAGCAAGGAGGGASSTTTVTIPLGSTPTAVGVLTTTPPPTIASFRIDVLQGGAVVRTATARPGTTVQMTLANGSYTFRLVGLDGGGIPLYQGQTPARLTGVDLVLSITLSGYVAVVADHTSVNPGDAVHFTAQFMNAPPTAANPLIWSATGGTVTVDANAANGAAATWIAPQQAGGFTVTAKVDPAVNPEQVANGSGDTVITVVDLPPLVVPRALRFAVPGLAGVGISPQISATGWAAIANWASGTRVIDDLGGVTTLPAARLAASYPIGDTPFRWSATDGAGQTTTVQSTLHVYAPATNVTLKVTDTAGNPLPNVRIAALARSSYAVVSLVDQNGNNRTDAAGQLLPAALDPGESYLLSFVSGDRYADGLLAGGNVVSSYQGAQAVTPASNGVVTAAMEGSAGRIAGQVVDGGGAAIPYARVDVAPLPYSELGAHLVTVADSQGDFSASVPPGDYYVMAAGSTIDPAIAAEQPLASMLAGGFYTADYAPVSPYSSAAGRVTVTAGTTRAVYMQLATGGLIAGRVTTTAGTPAVNMRVNLEPYGVAGAHRFTAVTDLNGVFQRNLPPGEYRIAATGVVFDPVSHSEQGIAGGWVGGYLSDGSGTLSWNTSAALIHPLAAGGQRVVTLTLTPGGTIRGQVTPAVAARVRIFARDGAGTITQRVFADAAGNYAINMPAGTVRLVVDSYAMDARTGQLTPLIGVVGGWVDANGIAQPLQAGAQAIALSAGQTVTRNIQLNAGTPFDAAAVVGAYIP